MADDRNPAVPPAAPSRAGLRLGAQARAAEAKLREEPGVGGVGPGPVTSSPATREPVVTTRTDATHTRDVDRGRAGDAYDPARDPANVDAARRPAAPLREPAPRPSAPNYDDDVRYAEREGSPGYGESRDPDQLQDEIELLQNRMAQRLDGITSAFEPQNLIASVTGEKNPDIFTTTDTVIDAARRNPVAASLIGAGLAALFFGSRTTERPVRPAEPHERPEPGVERVDADGRRYAASGVADPSSLDRVEENVKVLQDATAARLDAATTAARETYEEARQRLSSGTSYAADTSRDAVAWVRENPMAIGLGALAAGALAAGYYTASAPRRKPVPQSRALTVRDDGPEPYERLRDRRDYPAGGTPMPVSAAAPAPMPPSMGVGIGAASAGGVVGGSGQIVTPGEVRDTVPATPRGGVQPVGGVASSTSRDSTTKGPTGGSSASGSTTGSSSGSTTGPTAGATPSGGAAAGEVARDPSRVPSGAGFGSTAASRGEVASKPSDGTPGASEKVESSKAASSKAKSSKAKSSETTSPSASGAPTPVGSAAMGAGVDPAPTPSSPAPSSTDRLDAMKGAGETESGSTLTTPREEAERRKDAGSSSTDDLTGIYKGS